MCFLGIYTMIIDSLNTLNDCKRCPKVLRTGIFVVSISTFVLHKGLCGFGSVNFAYSYGYVTIHSCLLYVYDMLFYLQ